MGNKMSISKIVGYSIGTLCAIDILNGLLSPRIKNISELEKQVWVQAKKLDLDLTPVTINLKNYTCCYVLKHNDGKIELNLGGYGLTKAMVRHELYHIKYHLSNSGNITSLLYEEPAAIIYSYFNLKL